MAMVERARVFFLIGKLDHSLLAANVVATLPRILEFCANQPRPFTAKLLRPDGGDGAIGVTPGKAELWMDEAGWLEWRKRRR
jgi:hypothetical protein